MLSVAGVIDDDDDNDETFEICSGPGKDSLMSQVLFILACLHICICTQICTQIMQPIIELDTSFWFKCLIDLQSARPGLAFA